jgi:acetolactate synthase I/II/III large subunit
MNTARPEPLDAEGPASSSQIIAAAWAAFPVPSEASSSQGAHSSASTAPAVRVPRLVEGLRRSIAPELGQATDARRRGSAGAIETTAAHAILDILEAEGVRFVFGVPGGPLTGLFEAMHERGSIRLVLAKNEIGAAFMAAAAARVTRSLAVCCATSGPGATNALTGIASAFTDSLPVLLLTGQVARFVFGKGAIQESSVHGIDVVDLFRPVTKLSAMLPDVSRTPDILRMAIRTALSGRHGPVHISMPADIISRPVRYEPLQPRAYRPIGAASIDPDAIDAAARILASAKRPCVLAGYGVSRSNAYDVLLDFAHTLGCPVATSPKGKGVFPEDDPLALGVLGFGGQGQVERLLASGAPDALVIVGSSLNEFVTNAWTVDVHQETARIHIDIEGESIGRNYPIDVALVGDARATLKELLARVRALGAPSRRGVPWKGLSNAPPPVASPSSVDQEQLGPEAVIKELRDAMDDETMLFVDNGSAIVWATHFFEARRPDTYFIDLGLSCMGSAVAGVIGAAIAARESEVRPKAGRHPEGAQAEVRPKAGRHPEGAVPEGDRLQPRPRRAVALVGDAAFAMLGSEVHTAVEERLPVVWVVLNNGGHGMVHHGDKLMKGKDLGVSLFRTPIDCAGWATALGATGVRAETPAEFRSAIREALRADGPVVIDAVVDPTEVPPTLGRRVEALRVFFGSRNAGQE